MEAVFNFSEEHDKHELAPINAKMKVIQNKAGTCIEVQACGRFITFELNLVENGKINLLECSEEFITEGLKL